jgi:hypothetical protein
MKAGLRKLDRYAGLTMLALWRTDLAETPAPFNEAPPST